MLNRRQFLLFGAAAAATSVFGLPAEATARFHRERSVSLHNVHTGESVRTVYWADGKYSSGALRSLNKVLRDHRNDKVHSIDARVIDLLAVLQIKLHAQHGLTVISGYRSPESNAMLASMSDGVAQHSLHMEGKAVDIRVPGLSVRSVGKVAKGLRAGGVGTYPSSNFVHVDVGRVRYW